MSTLDHDRNGGAKRKPFPLSEPRRVASVDANTRAIFGRSYAAEPDRLIEKLKKDEAIAEADTLLIKPNQLGVDDNAHVIEAILKHVAPATGVAVRGAWGGYRMAGMTQMGPRAVIAQCLRPLSP